MICVVVVNCIMEYVVVFGIEFVDKDLFIFGDGVDRDVVDVDEY